MQDPIAAAVVLYSEERASLVSSAFVGGTVKRSVAADSDTGVWALSLFETTIEAAQDPIVDSIFTDPEDRSHVIQTTLVRSAIKRSIIAFNYAGIQVNCILRYITEIMEHHKTGTIFANFEDNSASISISPSMGRSVEHSIIRLHNFQRIDAVGARETV